MAGTTDPRAAAFDATAFRDGIRFAMNMGLSQAVEDRPTFRWTTKKSYSVEDTTGQPFDLSARPAVTETHEDVQIPVAIEFVNATASVGTSLGLFQNVTVVLTVLDEDYVLVEGADMVLMGGDTYRVNYVAPPIGLFDATIYQIYVQAGDES